eukprot:3785884-Pleurochrysis_carterae.AAC.2
MILLVSSWCAQDYKLHSGTPYHPSLSLSVPSVSSAPRTTLPQNVPCPAPVKHHAPMFAPVRC